MPSPEPIRIQQLPQTIEQFVALRDEIAQTPYGGASIMVMALLTHAEDADLGQQALTIAVDRSRPEEGVKGYKGWQLSRRDMQRINRQLEGKAYLPRAYLQHTSPAQGYALPDPPYVVAFQDNPYSGDIASGQYKTFVLCTGAASPRPVTLKRNNRGIWKAAEWSSLIVGVEPPVSRIADDL